MSTAMIAGLIWTGFAAHSNQEWDLIEKRLDSAWVVAPVAQRLGALQQSMTRHRNITPGEDFTGYS